MLYQTSNDNSTTFTNSNGVWVHECLPVYADGVKRCNGESLQANSSSGTPYAAITPIGQMTKKSNEAVPAKRRKIVT